MRCNLVASQCAALWAHIFSIKSVVSYQEQFAQCGTVPPYVQLNLEWRSNCHFSHELGNEYIKKWISLMSDMCKIVTKASGVPTTISKKKRSVGNTGLVDFYYNSGRAREEFCHWLLLARISTSVNVSESSWNKYLQSHTVSAAALITTLSLLNHADNGTNSHYDTIWQTTMWLSLHSHQH
jgi:hypothetical protein